MAQKVTDYKLAKGIEEAVREVKDYTLDDVESGKMMRNNFGESKRVLAVITFPGKKLILFDNPKYREEQGEAVKAFMEWAK